MRPIADEKVRDLLARNDGLNETRVFENIFVQFESYGSEEKTVVSGGPQMTFGQFCLFAVERLGQKDIQVHEITIAAPGAPNPAADTPLSDIRDRYGDEFTGIVRMRYV